MEIKLYDYNRRAVMVNIPDDATVVCGLVVSGDMVMNYPILFDTGEGSRWNDHIEGYWKVEVAELQEFNLRKSSYDILKGYGY